jgi:diguanylate cyclase (GGDEF)-like protein
LRRAERDVLALGVAVAAIIMFVGTGSAVMPQVVRSWVGGAEGPNLILTNTLLLNIALVVFGWRRYRELNEEVRQRRRAEDEARLLAETDPLTGCLNRRSIGPATDHLVTTAAERGEAVAFLMLDLDKFKQINDLNGHAAGDAILTETAKRISAALPERALIARLGGDEFACVVPFSARNSSRIDQLCGAIIERVSQPATAGGIVIEATVSVGVARSDTADGQKNGQPVDAQTLLHMADIAMYQAKKQGRNRYYWFEPSMESELRFRSELEAGIRRGIPAGEFVPYYEQQIDLETGQVVGFEMLARWESPKLGMIGPEVFIPIAEEVGLIADLSENLIRRALIDARSWDPRLTLSVNISPIQLRDPWFAQKLLRMLVEANFPPSRLEIEITETCLHENIGVVRTLITSLKNQGIQISLDDFGTGYSSLSQLRTLPFDRIKIDRSFVMSLAESDDGATIIQAITSLAEGLNMPITAEGIESEAVLEKIRAFGKFKGQGYFYGRPETADQTSDRLRGLNMLLNNTSLDSGVDQPFDTDRRASNG